MVANTKLIVNSKTSKREERIRLFCNRRLGSRCSSGAMLFGTGGLRGRCSSEDIGIGEEGSEEGCEGWREGAREGRKRRCAQFALA